MASKTQQIADAIVNYINAPAQQSGYNTAFTAVRKNLPLQELENMGTEIHVVVFPGPRTVTRVGRSTAQKFFQFIIGVMIRRPSEDLTTEDLVIELAEQIEDSMFADAAFQMSVGKRFEEGELNTPPFVPEELERTGVMASFVPVTYYDQTTV